MLYPHPNAPPDGRPMSCRLHPQQLSDYHSHPVRYSLGRHPTSRCTPSSRGHILPAPTPAGSGISSPESQKPAVKEQSHYNGAFDLGQASGDPSVGGLSGLTALADGSYLAISDDKGNHGPTRAYRLSINNSYRVKMIGQINFTTPDSNAYNPKDFDAEEIRQLPNGHLLWTTEGKSQGSENRSPLMIESDGTGREIRRIHPPRYHVPNHDEAKAVEQTRGITEGMTTSLDGKTFYTLNENSLVQDGPINTSQMGSKTRLTVYNTATGKPSAEYVVDVDPTYAPNADRGYASLATSPKGNLYALQRGYIPKQGNRAEIYRLNIKGASNVLGREQLNGTEIPVNRKKIFDFADPKPSATHKPGDVSQPSITDKHSATKKTRSDVSAGSLSIQNSPENVEGLTFAAPPARTSDSPSNGQDVGVRTPDGFNRVYLTSDDNFSDSQRTLLHSLDIPRH